MDDGSVFGKFGLKMFGGNFAICVPNPHDFMFLFFFRVLSFHSSQERGPARGLARFVLLPGRPFRNSWDILAVLFLVQLVCLGKTRLKRLNDTRYL